MSAFQRQCLDFITQTHLVQEGDAILAAVSGGADSTALLLYFALELKPRFHLKLAAAHLNHGLRGKASDADQAFVEKLCAKLNIPVFSEKRRMTRKKNESPEETARRIRYAFLAKTAEKQGFGKIATAHHLDDQAETLLMRLLTGTGLSGLAGIRPKNKNIIRPLLTLSRKDILAYLKTRKQGFRIDKSNRDERFFRNKIRLRLIPYLKKHFGHRIPEALARLSLQAGEDMGCSEENAKRLLAPLILEEKKGRLLIDSVQLAAYPRYLIKTLLEAAFRKLGRPVSLSSAHITSLILRVFQGGQGGAVDLPKGLRAERSYENLLLKVTRQQAFIKPNRAITVTVMKNTKINAFPKATDTTAFFDFETLSLPITVRCRRPGDCFHPLGAPGTMKLKDFLINQKAPKDERDEIRVLCSGKTIAWVVGHRISERFKVRPETRKIAVIALSK